MLWVALALLTAVLTAGREVAVKAVSPHMDAVEVSLGISAVVVLVLAPLVLLGGFPSLGRAFWPALLVSGSINAVAIVLIVRALHLSDLSLVAPLKSLTPLVMVASSPFVLGELPTPAGLAGVVAIVAGAYLLDLGSRTDAPGAPFAALLADPGARLMLLVAVLFGVSAVVDKVGVTSSSPLTWAAALNVWMLAALAPVAGWRRLQPGRGPERRARAGAGRPPAPGAPARPEGGGS